jgi:hypothetical protein
MRRILTSKRGHKTLIPMEIITPTKQVKRAAAVNSGRKSDILPPVLLVVALLRPSVGDLIFIRVCGVWSGAVAIANNLADYRMHIERKKKKRKKKFNPFEEAARIYMARMRRHGSSGDFGHTQRHIPRMTRGSPNLLCYCPNWSGTGAIRRVTAFSTFKTGKMGVHVET